MKKLLRPIDNAILVYFRFFAGILLSWELVSDLIQGSLKEYISPGFHFSYMYFDWIKPWPHEGMILHYALTICAGFFVAFNIYYRFASIILFLGYASLFLMEKAEYINHFYLYSLVAFWLMVLPLNRKRGEAPAWILYLLLFHISVVYFYAGLAKINPDWLSGNTMNHFMGNRGYHNLEWARYIAWAGMLFDLLVVPLLLIRFTRVFAFIAAVTFHISNALMFGLATFPWFALMMTAMFFDPSWPRIFYPKLTPFNKYIRFFKLPSLTPLITLYCILQVTIPLRLHLYPGDTHWTEEGHMFAWRMKLRSKSGNVHYFVKNKSTQETRVISPQSYLTEKQYRTLVGKPDQILEFAHYLRDEFKGKLGWDVEIRASSMVGVNGSMLKEMIKQGVDLSQEERKIGPYSWIQL